MKNRIRYPNPYRQRTQLNQNPKFGFFSSLLSTSLKRLCLWTAAKGTVGFIVGHTGRHAMSANFYHVTGQRHPRRTHSDLSRGRLSHPVNISGHLPTDRFVLITSGEQVPLIIVHCGARCVEIHSRPGDLSETA